MSKKLLSTSAWNLRCKIRRAKREKRNRRKRYATKSISMTLPRDLRKIAARIALRSKKPTVIIAPEDFSLITDPDETLLFFERMQIYRLHNNVEANFSAITHISPEAVAALVATLDAEPSKSDFFIRGNFPAQKESLELLSGSGFFEYVEPKVSVAASQRGKIFRKKSQFVEPHLAKELVHYGTEQVFGRSERCQAAYGTLIDCMNNTFNHAAWSSSPLQSWKKQKRETWYATVYADVERKRVCFTFLDTGVGIFRSIKLRELRRVYRFLKIYSEVEIIKDLLNGKVGSRTGLAYRGKGLPSIYKASQRGDLLSLVVIANNVYANIDRDDFRILKSSFQGTLLYWEIEEKL